MEGERHRIGKRVGLLALACLVLLGTAVPVMADPAEPESPSGSESPSQASEHSTPGPASIASAHRDYVREGEEREAELEGQSFVAQRESSRHAYEDDTPAEAEELLRSTFDETLARLNEEPARFLSDARLDENLGHGSAVVTAEGKTEILEAGQPIEAEDSEGETKKVDVSLEKGPEGFEAENPLVEVAIGATAEEGVEVGEEGLTVTQVGAEGTRGRLLGDKNVFYGEVEEGSDTDLMVSPTSRGVELFDMLRSVDSPETLRFHLELPEGDTLKLLRQNGVEILDPEGSIVGLVNKPSAEDAQGTEVPVELGLEGDTVTLRTHHREEDLAYPILVDPETEITQNWETWWIGGNSQGLGSWWEPNSFGNPAAAHFTKGTVGGGQWAGMSGLFESIESGHIPAGSTGEWVLNSPNPGTYIANVGGYPFWRYNGSAAACPLERGDPYDLNPYDFEGLYDNSPGQNLWIDLQFNQAWTTQNISLPAWGHQLIFGLSSSPEYLQCWRDLMLGGVHFTLGDWQPPVMQAVSSSVPNRWINGSTPFSVYADATDGGLGVTEFFVNPGAEVGGKTKLIGCLGNYESPCPSNAGREYWFVGAEFAQGEREVVVTARSPSNKNSNAMSFPLKLDLERPVLHIDGQLASAIQEAGPGEAQGQGGPELNQPVYNLKVEASDGTEGTTEGKRKQSGVKTVEVTVTDASGTKVESAKAFPNTNPTCPQGSCAEGPNGQGITYAIPMTGLAAGKHHLIVKAWDFAENPPAELQREFEYFPATGLTEEDITQRFLLPDDKDHGEGNYQGPELAVNVMNGNVVYHQRDVEVEGPNTNLEVELFYNSQLPKEESSEFGSGWTLSQTPTLKPGTGTQPMATAVTSESELTGNVALPQEVGKEQFSDKLDAVITKEPGGGYSVSEGGGESPATVYDSSGRAVEEQTSPTSAVEYGYEGEHLAEIAVDDPGTTSVPPNPVEKAPSIVPNYVSSFGSAGTGNGQFAHPAEVALDAKGDEWIVDSGGNRVEEFTPGGGFIRSVGAIGIGNGQFHNPRGLAIDASGNVWVTDFLNNRLEEFGPTGTFLKAVGSKGAGNGQFSGPAGVAVAPSGHILVSDTNNHRIVELSAAGEFIKALNPSGLGEIEPAGVDVGPEGQIWVADRAHNRVVELNAAGELIRQVGSTGSGEGQFKSPDGVAVGALGEVWVGDTNNERVQEFTKEGAYVTQFGSAGSGDGQFTFGTPMGLATDNAGSLFVTDGTDKRVEHWQIPHYGYRPIYAATFGSTGTGPGQFRVPAGLAVDGEGNVWVPDAENNRIQELNPKGEFVRQIGSTGTGNGQFQTPKSIAFTPEGELWVADTGNSRLEEFAGDGTFIRSVGKAGAGNGQFSHPDALAVAPDGHIWVSDTSNHRIVELDEEGNFIRVVNPTGLGSIEPTGIAFGPGGNAWIADWTANRVVEINPAGELVRQFGTSGNGNGQFKQPDMIAVDDQGLVYVIDQTNGRVQVFNQAGEYLAQFGAQGTGLGQFSFALPSGIATDGRGDLWISDGLNNRIEKWQTGSWVPAEEEVMPTQDDPAVEVNTSAGLVTSVVGAEAGSHHYAHAGQLLTSDEGPEGTTHYEYEGERLKKITLPAGTTAAIEYDNLGRATKVTVDPAGVAPAKSTKFTYTQEINSQVAANHGVASGSREVEVEPETEKRTFYAIDAAGDVVKSWNVEVGPTIVRETGTFVARKEKELESQETQELFVKGSAPEGIKSIQFIANGSTIVDEKTCTGTAVECEHLELQWIVEPGDLTPGTMWIEVVLTSRVEEKKTAERWWVTVPYIPPPPAGVPQPPKYKEVLNFREEYGLDLDLNPITDEMELHERVRETIGAWHDPESPAGQVAYATWERWGIPLRYVDEQELEYREWLYNTNAEKIDKWVEETEPANFSGYYLDNRVGGIMYVGFLGDQQAQLTQLKALLNLVAPARVEVYPVPPTVSFLSARATAQAAVNAIEATPSLSEHVISIKEEKSGTALRVGATNVAQVESSLLQAVPGAHLTVVPESGSGELLGGRFRTSGRMRGGDGIFIHHTVHEVYETRIESRKCTAGFGAKDKAGERNGQALWRLFVLTAGHCDPPGDPQEIYRTSESEPASPSGWVEIGDVTRSGYAHPNERLTVDAEAARVEDPGIVPQGQWSAGGELAPTGPAGTVKLHNTVCFSGAVTERLSCGQVTEISKYWDGAGDNLARAGYWVKFQYPAVFGDSGAPVWSIFGDSIGLISARGGSSETHGQDETFVEPLLTPPGLDPNKVYGVLTDPYMRPLSLKIANDGS
jgi:sugar lactone lactonase YvrE